MDKGLAIASDITINSYLCQADGKGVEQMIDKFCYTCGKLLIDKSYIYAYDQQTGKPLIAEYGECPSNRWYTIGHHAYPNYDY